MGRNIKINTTDEDFKNRIEKAINLIAGQEFIVNKKTIYKFSKEELLKFEFEDTDLINDMHDSIFFNGDYVFFPKEKVIWV